MLVSRSRVGGDDGPGDEDRRVEDRVDADGVDVCLPYETQKGIAKGVDSGESVWGGADGGDVEGDGRVPDAPELFEGEAGVAGDAEVVVPEASQTVGVAGETARLGKAAGQVVTVAAGRAEAAAEAGGAPGRAGCADTCVDVEALGAGGAVVGGYRVAVDAVRAGSAAQTLS